LIGQWRRTAAITTNKSGQEENDSDCHQSNSFRQTQSRELHDVEDNQTETILLKNKKTLNSQLSQVHPLTASVAA
jgi:hypothetical protein